MEVPGGNERKHLFARGGRTEFPRRHAMGQDPTGEGGVGGPLLRPWGSCSVGARRHSLSSLCTATRRPWGSFPDVDGHKQRTESGGSARGPAHMGSLPWGGGCRDDDPRVVSGLHMTHAEQFMASK